MTSRKMLRNSRFSADEEISVTDWGCAVHIPFLSRALSEVFYELSANHAWTLNEGESKTKAEFSEQVEQVT